MVSINDVPVNDLINKTAESLKQIPEIKPPEWALYAKTGMHKERPPMRNDWWYMRAAAVLRATSKLGPIGVSKLRTKYGGRKNRGHKPDRFYKGSGNIIRKILQQLEKAQLVKQIDKDKRKGRIIAPKGVSLLNKAAYEVSKNVPKVKPAPEPKKVEPKQEIKPAPNPAEKPQPKAEEKKPKVPKKNG